MSKISTVPLLAACLTLIAGVPTLQAQTADKLAKAEAVAHELKLTPEQEAKVLPILRDEGPKVQAIKNDSSLSGMQKIKKLRAIHAETDPQMKKILSPEQYQKLQEIREQRIKEAMAAKRAGR